MMVGDGGGGDCGGVSGEVFCGAPVPAADEGLVAAAPVDSGVSCVGNYRVTREGIVRVGAPTGKKPETDAQD
jgi:hypothetical protein